MRFMVMLANTANAEMYYMTRAAIETVNKARGKNSLLTLVETNSGLQSESFYKEPYAVDRFMQMTPFNYNRALAFAVQDFKLLSSDFFCVLNNDIIVKPGAFDLLDAALEKWDVVSAWSESTLVQKNFHHKTTEGYIC